MYFGIVLSGYNHLYFDEKINLYCETIPQLIFTTCIFGYLVFLIIFKWSVPMQKHPSLLSTMIDMILSPFSMKQDQKMFYYQKQIQNILLFISFICVLWMSFAKPVYLMKNRRATYCSSLESQHDYISNTTVEPISHHQPTNNCIDIFILQIIHTIEFVLGSVSNTASYLRLWALSLAHAQLSHVLWSLLIKTTFDKGIIIAGIGWILWFSLTIFILVILEGLSAFLHSLRLHWIEFNNKFFHGEGYLFDPLTFDVKRDE